MIMTTRSMRLLTGAVLLTNLVSATPVAERPSEVLQQAFTKQFSNPAILVQETGVPWDDRFKFLFKVQLTGDRTLRTILLQPISMQGSVMVDDGRDLYTQLPDKKMVLVQMSARRFTPQPKERIKLVERNYKLKSITSPDIAGRTCIAVEATPKAKEVYVRRFFLDKQNYTMLRTEVVKNGVTTKSLDTKSVEYVDAKDRIAWIYLGDQKVERTDAPRPVRNLAHASSRVGFEPLVADKIPYGFEVQAIQLLGEGDDCFIGIRMTDGLANVTVYEWLPERLSRKSRMRHVQGIKDARGVFFGAFGDIAPEACVKIAEAFVSHSDKSRD